MWSLSSVQRGWALFPRDVGRNGQQQNQVFGRPSGSGRAKSSTPADNHAKLFVVRRRLFEEPKFQVSEMRQYKFAAVSRCVRLWKIMRLMQIILWWSTDFLRDVVGGFAERRAVTVTYVCEHCKMFLVEDFVVGDSNHGEKRKTRTENESEPWFDYTMRATHKSDELRTASVTRPCILRAYRLPNTTTTAGQGPLQSEAQ